MPEYLAPGLFVEEIDSGSKPIEGVGTATAAFVGYAKSGDFNKPTFVTNFTQFCQAFGEEENALTIALCKEFKMTVAEVRYAKQASRKGWMEFAQTYFRKMKDEGKTTSPTFEGFLTSNAVPRDGMPYIEKTEVRDGKSYTKKSYLAHAVKGFFDNGGGRAYIIRVAHPDDMEALSFDLSSKAAASDGRASGPVAAQITAGPLLIAAKNPGTVGNDIKVEVEHVGKDEFKIKVTKGDVTETFPGGDDAPLKVDTALKAVNQFSNLIKLEKGTATATRPDAKVFTLTGGLDAGTVPAKATGSSAPPAGSPLSNGLATLQPNDFIGAENIRTGLGGMVPIDDVNFICAPDFMYGLFEREPAVSMEPGKESVGPEVLVSEAEFNRRAKEILMLQNGLVAHCESNSYRMAILDPLPGLNPMQMRDLVTKDQASFNCAKGQATIYYPWIKIADPMHKGEMMLCPPSGHIGGVWARVSVERGVHKAPANEVLIGSVAVERDITKGEQEILNPDGINCIRVFPGRGIRIWGARTLATLSNASWKYVNVRRLFNYLEQSMERALQWVVFEPNDEDLWGRVRRNVAAFLFTEWKEGKLFGATPADAFYVKCDTETNPQEMIDLGRLYCEIGVNPVKPAEFVIIRIGQWASSSSVGES